jgi:hypothetical protein
VARRRPELEMYAVIDPRVALLNELRRANPGTERRMAQWPTWQADRSWPGRAPARIAIERLPVSELRRDGRQWNIAVAAFMALGVVATGLLAAGIGKGLL